MAEPPPPEPARVRFRAMRPAEFDTWRDRAILDYADEIQRNERVSTAAARHKSETDFERLLPVGPATPDHDLLVLEDEDTGAVVGSLWIGLQEHLGVRQAYVFDIVIDQHLRGRGLGRRALELVEEWARARGAVQIALNVFGDNEVAQGLYRSSGFRTVALAMVKPLSPQPAPAPGE
jgi:ribosomal protein S18 acetylase RimI-like enzyme